MPFLPDAEVLAVGIVCGGDQIVDQIQLGDYVGAAILKRAQLAAVDQLIDRVFAKGRLAAILLGVSTSGAPRRSCVYCLCNSSLLMLLSFRYISLPTNAPIGLQHHNTGGE